MSKGTVYLILFLIYGASATCYGFAVYFFMHDQLAWPLCAAALIAELAGDKFSKQFRPKQK